MIAFCLRRNVRFLFLLSSSSSSSSRLLPYNCPISFAVDRRQTVNEKKKRKSNQGTAHDTDVDLHGDRPARGSSKRSRLLVFWKLQRDYGLLSSIVFFYCRTPRSLFLSVLLALFGFACCCRRFIHVLHCHFLILIFSFFGLFPCSRDLTRLVLHAMHAMQSSPTTTSMPERCIFLFFSSDPLSEM